MTAVRDIVNDRKQELNECPKFKKYVAISIQNQIDDIDDVVSWADDNINRPGRCSTPPMPEDLQNTWSFYPDLQIEDLRDLATMLEELLNS